MVNSAFVTPLFRPGSVHSRWLQQTSGITSLRPPCMLTKSLGRKFYHRVQLHNAPVVGTTFEVTPPSATVSTGTDIDSDTILRDKGYRPGDLVLLFDGVCVLCNAGVDFVLKHDISKQIKFAALQSDVGQMLLDKFNAPKDLSTVVLIQDNKAFTKSEAILRVGRHLNWYFSIPAALALMGLPKPVRDYFYSNVVAKNRYEWFGEKEECRLVDEENLSRFLY